MITIPIKIKREDKEVMILCLEKSIVCHIDFGDIQQVFVYEIFIEILSKLRASQHNNKAIRLNVGQVMGFMTFVANIYSSVGSYEMANAHILAEKIRKEIPKKAIKLKD